jgi:thiazole tautomerase (transcriptional regulator TenI)
MPLIDVPSIHAVTDPRILAEPGFMSQAEAVFRALGTSGAVHLRAPGISASRLYSIASYLKELGEVTGCRLVINDRADIGAAVPAWGLQLGRRSMTAGAARLAAPGLAIGMSVHSMAEAQEAADANANWIFAGHVFETPSHSGIPSRGPGFIGDVTSLGIPVIAIGGILPRHVSSLKAAGAHGVAAIRGIWEAPDPGAAARAYLQES